jgi:hypothetical protein
VAVAVEVTIYHQRQVVQVVLVAVVQVERLALMVMVV